MGWMGVVSRFRNEAVLFHQCSMFYTARKMRLSAAGCVALRPHSDLLPGLCEPLSESVPTPTEGG